MNFDKALGKIVGGLSKAIISLLPKKNFTTPEKADKYMLTGDSSFSKSLGEYFSCGFGKEVVTPVDADSGKYFIAGYDSNNPAKGVLDDMYARAVYIDDNTGRGGAVICSVDAVGFSRHDINDIRRLVLESGKVENLKSISICATHTHSAVDTQGLWGEKFYKSGKNPEYMEYLKEKTAQAIINAYLTRKDGKLFYSVADIEDMLYDHRKPDCFDTNLTKITFRAFDGSKNIQIINFACHAELLGSKTTQISADFPCYLIKEIEAHNENTEVVFINGAIGGMISAKEIKKVYRNEIDCEAYTRDFGKQAGAIANAIEVEEEISPLINVKSVPLKIKASNYVLILARILGVFNNDIFRSPKRSQALLSTEIGYMELGSEQLGMFLIPGELFPELWNGGFHSAEESATGKEAEYNILCNQTPCKHNFVVGLCNDELGYIIPDNDFILNQDMPYINSGKDRFGRGHYEETNSTGPDTARAILDGMQELINSAKGDCV